MTSKKSFAISKRMVFEAWKRVKANRGAAGIDVQSITKFEESIGKITALCGEIERRGG